MINRWTIEGAGGQPVRGDCHVPEDPARGAVVIAHGFKGYKDYGMFPAIARACADAGFVAHRFNFSHSGMTEEIETFGRPDLFEQDTWNRQVSDLRMVVTSMAAGSLPGGGLPYILLGHSRGGVTVLLTAGRHTEDPTFPMPAGLVTVAAPGTCNSLTKDQGQQLLKEGFLESPSARTGQRLKIGRAFLQEQLDQPAGHDLPALVGRIRCPLLVVHGENDPSVPASSARIIKTAARCPVTTRIVAGADHVFNTPNPMPEDQPPSPQLQELIDAVVEFAGESVERPGD